MWPLVVAAVPLAACGEDEPQVEGAGGEGGQGLSSGSWPQTGSGATENDCEAQSARLASSLETAYFEGTQIGGAALAVITEGCGRWLGAVGEARPDEELTPSHLMRVGSVTKTYVGAALVDLADRGELSLDDTINVYVADVPDGNLITVRMLLNHTSGIYNYTDDATYMAWLLNHPADPVAPADMVAAATAHPPSFAPGDGWAYSNTGYILAGMVLEAVTGGSVADALRHNALNSAALDSTFFDGEEPLPNSLARGYDAAGADVTHALHPSVPWAAGSIVATVGDVADWGAALFGGEVLSPDALDEMLAPAETGLTGVGYGLGVFRWDAAMLGGLSDALGHGGDIPGYHSELIYLEADRTVIAVMVNCDSADPQAYLNAALLALYPDMR